MRKLSVLVSFALAALWGARSAEAQVIIDPAGPLCVASDATSSTYVATVTTNYDFWLHLIVFHNGTSKHDSTTYVVNSGPTYVFSKVVDMTGWGMQAGDHLNYRGRATIAAGPYRGRYDEKDWQITVSAPGHCRAEKDRDRERRGWRCV
jgi:hypothetical protein